MIHAPTDISPDNRDSIAGVVGSQSPGALISAQRPDLVRKVTTAQRRVLELLLEGLSEPQIAQRIGRSKHTVHDHTKGIYSALGVNTRVGLVLLFSRPVEVQAPAAPRAAQGTA